MIIAIVGGIGSGKTLCAIKEIVSKNLYALTNFRLKNYKDYYRLKISDIIQKTTEYNDKGKAIEKLSINWDFWNKMRDSKKHFCIFLDELHNVLSQRSFMSSQSKLMVQWFSQIRKVMSDDLENHCYLISQSIYKIDIDARELVHIIVEVQKIEAGKDVLIICKWYEGLENYAMKRCSFKTSFKGNPFFRYYDRLEFVRFGDYDEYI